MKIYKVCFLLISVFGSFLPQLLAQPNRVTHQNRPLWVNGGNIAWISFGSDVGPGTTDLVGFGKMFREVRDNGGNSMRFWLHPTGNNLAWNGSDVTGLGAGFIQDLTAILDSAKAYDVSIMICLWSFDMLRTSNGATSTSRNMAVLTDSVKLARYINNALVPMVTALKDHPAILAWEVFNEPEGMSNEFGWDGIQRVPMSTVQRVVNRVAGAIKRVDSKLMVTNGAWSFKSTQDAIKQEINKDMNYYRNDRLIAAGGDPDGKLDFYTVHYYDWAGTNLSPFHHHFDRWQLDKPLVVAEFYIKGSVFNVSADSLYKVLHRNGYAGAMAWQWVDFVQNRDNNTATWPNALRNMRYMRDNHLKDVALSYNGMRFERFSASRTVVEPGQSFTLQWTVRGAETVTLNGERVPPTVASRSFSLQESRVFTLRGVSTTGVADSVQLTVMVQRPEDINRLSGAILTASNGTPEAIADGNPATSWRGNGAGSFVSADLLETYFLDRVRVDFGDISAPVTEVDVSVDGVVWKNAARISAQQASATVLFENAVEANRIRFIFPEPVPADGPVVSDIYLTGTIAAVQPPKISLTGPATVLSLDVGSTLPMSATVTPGTQPVERVVFFAGADSIGADATAPYTFNWVTARPGSYEVFAVAVTANHRIQTVSRTVTVLPAVQIRRFEAENAARTGTLAVVTENGASGARYVRMEATGNLTWSGVSIATAGEYTLRIGYRLPFDVKTQYINVNEQRVAEVIFDGALNQWLTKDVKVQLAAGVNSIQIENFWGYMHFDYVDIRGDGQTVVSNEQERTLVDFTLHQNYPNPFNPVTVIPFSLDRAAEVRIDVLDMNGRVVLDAGTSRFAAGSHQIQVDASALSSGIYLYRMVSGGKTMMRKMTLLK
jgi:hypothetical protein